MATPYTLSRFIDWAYKQCKADHYCLVLWGHGPELLIEDDPAEGGRKTVKKFLTPPELAKALADTEFHRAGRKLDMIAIDACSMSMMEAACELPEYARFLIASQEDVPDFSFPYGQLLVFAKDGNGDEVKRLCQEIPHRYIEAYGDYILTKETEIESITLSSLSLHAVDSVTEPLCRLADALLRGVHDKEKRQAVIRARANYKGFVAGLYTDLYEFCNQLQSELSSSSNDILDKEIKSACRAICDAIALRDENGLVLANEVSKDRRCHGISIYFPFWKDFEKDAESVKEERILLEGSGIAALESVGNESPREKRIEAPPEGGTEGTKGGINVLSKGGINVLSKGGINVLSKEVLDKVRGQRIEETEQYYRDLMLSKSTRWGEFIRHGWSRWLAEEVETKMRSGTLTDKFDTLDTQYSAQQCAVNLLSLCREKEKSAAAGSNG